MVIFSLCHVRKFNAQPICGSEIPFLCFELPFTNTDRELPLITCYPTVGRLEMHVRVRRDFLVVALARDGGP
jgi:hypothetical protein